MADCRNLIAVLDAALEEVDRAQRADWQKVNGESAAENLLHLEAILSRAREEATIGGVANRSELVGLVKWVSDWIPDVEDPLLPALGAVEQCLG